MAQVILSGRGRHAAIPEILAGSSAFLVCGGAFDAFAALREVVLPLSPVIFRGFAPNPEYADMRAGLRLFQENGCDFILAVGGGSAIDVAKCIRLYGENPRAKLLALPTTAGSGSESTHFAVLYKDGEKQSIAAILPDYVILDPLALETLPEYQRKATMMDAICHAVESIWARGGTRASQTLALEALRGALDAGEGYLRNDPEGNLAMLLAANTAGQAINISKTTAAHAMSYALTARFGFAHGHAAALCLLPIWNHMEKHAETLPGDALDILRPYKRRVEDRMRALALPRPALEDPAEIEHFVLSVNAERLGNHPLPLRAEDLRALYAEIFLPRGI